jgi:single-stranded DNA-binding protein
MAIEAAFFAVLGRDAELKTSAKGKQYLRLSCRVGDGEGASWVNCTSFDSEAIAVADKLTKSARVYVEGSIKLDKWTSQDGTERTGLSCLSWHTRLAAIGRNRPRKQKDDDDSNHNVRTASVSNNFHSDEIGF